MVLVNLKASLSNTPYAFKDPISCFFRVNDCIWGYYQNRVTCLYVKPVNLLKKTLIITLIISAKPISASFKRRSV